MKRTGIKRGTTRLRSRTPLRAVAARKRPSAKPVPLSVRKAVWERSDGVCECCGLAGANHIHHRKLRSQGGRHEPANLIHIHGVPCHHDIHANPERSYALGFLVRGWQDPADVPIIRTAA